jgi:hypothetical protein
VFLLITGCGMDGPAPGDKSGDGSTPNSRSAGPPIQLEPLGTADAPYIQGKISILGKLENKFVEVGFAGVGKDGQRYSSSTDLDCGPGSNNVGTSGNTKAFANGPDGPGFRHTKMSPGTYLVYVEQGGVYIAWKKVAVKPSDQLTVDLTIDPAKAGSINITWPHNESWGGRPMRLIPVEFDGLKLFPPDNLPVIAVGPNLNWAILKNVPAGNYHLKTMEGVANYDDDVTVSPGKQATVKF